MRRRRLIELVLLFTVVAVLAGCSTIGALIDTQNALRDAGYQSAKVSPKGATNALNVEVTVAATPSESNARDVASIVWQKFHERFDYLDITVHGQGPALRQQLTFTQMQEAFGARNPAWNTRSVKSSTLRVGVEAIIGVAVAFGAVVAIVLLVQRRNRRRRPPWPGPGYPGSGWPGSGYPGSGWPGSGYPGSGWPGSGYPGPGLPGAPGAPYPPPPPSWPPREG